MINTSDKLHIVNFKNIADDLNEALLLRMKHHSRPSLASPYKELTDSASLAYFAAEHYLLPRLNKINADDLSFFYDLATSKGQELRNEFEEWLGSKLSIDEEFSGIKSTLKVFFTFLWAKGRVVLTPDMTMPTISFMNISEVFKQSSALCKLHEYAVTQYSEEDRSTQTIEYRRTQSLKKAAHRFLVSTSWVNIKDVDLEETWKAIRNNEIVKSSRYGGMFKMLFDAACINGNEKFTKKDIANVYDRRGMTTARQALEHVDISSLKLLDNYLNGNVKLTSGQQFNVSSKAKSVTNIVKSNHIASGADINIDTLKVPDRLRAYHAKSDINNYLLNLTKYPKDHINFDYLKDDYYIGYEVSPTAEFSQWAEIIKAFIEYYRDDKVGVLRRQTQFAGKLADYLFVYLKNYYQASENTVGELPNKIDQFSRVIFWNNAVLPSDKREIAPKTLSKFLSDQLKKAHHLFLAAYDFFQFVELNYSDKFPSFKNPVNYELDVKPLSPERSKTSDKVALPIRTLPYVLNIFQAVHDALSELLEKLLILDTKTRHDIYHNKSKKFWKFSDYDSSCSFELNEKIHEIEIVPDFFNWSQHKEKGWLPSLSNFRMLRTNIHAGQRMENIQWLDINEFDKYGKVEGYFQSIHISIDKVFEHRACQVPTYIFDMLQAEKEFQQKYHHDSFKPIQSTNSTKFIDPLFKVFSSGAPVDDTSYQALWVNFLLFVQEIYNNNVPKNEEHTFVKLVPKTDRGRNPVSWNMGEPFVDDNGTFHQGNASQVVFRAIHTPHSMRNTYTVVRDTFISTKDLLQQQGWLSEVTKSHYLKAKHQDDRNKLLELGEEALLSGSLVVESEGNVYKLFLSGDGSISPSDKGSAISKSIEEKRFKEVINDQGMVSIFVPEMSEYSGEDGLSMLKNQRSVKPVVFDHCVCPAGGDCPAEVIEIVGERLRCGMCPIACSGIDNISGLNARISEKFSDAEEGLIQLKHLEARNVNETQIINLKKQIRLNQVEVAAMKMTVELLKKRLASGASEGYLSRMPEMVEGVIAIGINTDSEKGRFLSRLIESQAHPAYCSSNYIQHCERIIRSYGLDENFKGNSDPVSIVAGHITQLLEIKGIDLNNLIESKELTKLLGVI